MPWPPRFLFISGWTSIDFALTGGEGWRARFERWRTPADLAEWIRAAPGLGLAADVTPRHLREARRLREAIWHGAQQVIGGGDVSAALARVMNVQAASPSLAPRLTGGGKRWLAGQDAGRVLSYVARDAITLFGTHARSRLRKCRNPMCPLIFVDASRPGKRNWCAMRRCGNLNKLDRYRGGPGLLAPGSRAARGAP